MTSKRRDAFFRFCRWGVLCLFGFFALLFLLEFLRAPRQIGADSFWQPVPIGSYAFGIVLALFVLPAAYFLYRSFSLSFAKGKLLYYAGIGVLTLAVFLLQFYTVDRIYLYFQTDAMWMHIAAGSVVAGNPVAQNVLDYLAIHSQNVFLTFVFTVVMRIALLFGVANNYFPLLVGQSVFVCAGLVFAGILFEKLLKDKLIAFFAWIVFAVTVGLSTTLTLPYTDGYSLPFITGAALLYVVKPKDRVKRYLRSFFFGVVGMIGFRIKAQAAVVSVACFLWDFICFVRDKDKSLLFDWLVILLGLVFGRVVSDLCIRSMGMNLSFRKPLTLFHYFYMGANEGTLGMVNHEDWLFSIIYGAKADLVEGVKRIFNMGLFGYIDFLSEKFALVFTMPDFGFDSAWYTTYHPVPPYDAVGWEGFFINLFYVGGAHHAEYFEWMKSLWSIVMLLPLFSLPVLFRSRRREELFLMTAAIGIILFVLLFEANFRYVFSYVFVFVFLGARGLEGVADLIFEKRKGTSFGKPVKVSARSLGSRSEEEF